MIKFTNKEVSNQFLWLMELHTNRVKELTIRVKQLKQWLDRIVSKLLPLQRFQFTDLAVKINYISEQIGLDKEQEQKLYEILQQIHCILNNLERPKEESMEGFIKEFATFFALAVRVDLPKEFIRLKSYEAEVKTTSYRTESLRVSYLYAEADLAYVTPIDGHGFMQLAIPINEHPLANPLFCKTFEVIWKHAQLNLIDVKVDEERKLAIPQFVVLEPDYLIDISSLAECYRHYGAHPFNYILARIIPISNQRPLLLGSIANFFLDEWVNEKGEINYLECMQRVFKQYPLELASCEDLQNRSKELDFFRDCERHFDHIRLMVKTKFPSQLIGLNPDDAVLEPSYICEPLGLQGRLDYMQRDLSGLIEMKSGKADEFSARPHLTPYSNHQIQMMLYQAVLEYTLGKSHKESKAYLFYSRYPELICPRPDWRFVQQAIDLRNQIVANEHSIQKNNSLSYTEKFFSSITPNDLNINKVTGRFWNEFLRPSISKLGEVVMQLSESEKAYFYSVYNFIVKELYTSKSGDIDYEGATGAASLWLTSFEEKRESGEILYDLRLVENRASDIAEPILKLAKNREEEEALPNFRKGDVVVLYERNGAADSVLNKMVLKGCITSIDTDFIEVKLRAAQRNKEVIATDSLYAIEADAMDSTFNTMFRGLYSFATSNKERRSLLLGEREAKMKPSNRDESALAGHEQVVAKALRAEDLLLVVGPPGTGKTSFALKGMVEEFRKRGDTILLLSYTNRAVDEICRSIEKIDPELDYIRVGNEHSCDSSFKKNLLKNRLASCTKRRDVVERLCSTSIFVGTVASISGKPELFKLKRFNVAIIDEASQILEPQLLPILTATTANGKDAIERFVLIGDHKQLPAVVLQKKEEAAVQSDVLRRQGIENLTISFFERLYRANVGKDFTVWLTKQGRMHPDIARFPSEVFYKGRLGSLGLHHQLDPNVPLKLDSSYRIVNRVSFIPSEAELSSHSYKVNRSEACIIAEILRELEESNQLSSEEIATRVGIITPYRCQIALIKQYLKEKGVSQSEDVLVDTVERFQGSERDLIFYSFCVNQPYQLSYLSVLNEDEGQLIDKKLNVALTRAKKQLILTGVPKLLKLSPIYRKLLDFLSVDY